MPEATLQRSLFDSPAAARARRSDPETSKAAARTVPVADLEARVLETLRRRPSGLTSHEVAELLGLDLVSISPRFRPLVEKNLVVVSNERRRGPSGRSSIVWRVAT